VDEPEEEGPLTRRVLRLLGLPGCRCFGFCFGFCLRLGRDQPREHSVEFVFVYGVGHAGNCRRQEKTMAETCDKLNCPKWVSGRAEELPPVHNHFGETDSKPKPLRRFFWCEDHAEEIKESLHQRGIEFRLLSPKELASH
jgi:hypothetical protein